MYGEDIDLSWRIVQAGFTNYYLPTARITHFKGKSSKKDNPERIRNFHNAMITFSQKYSSGFCRSVIIAAIYAKMHLTLFFSFFHRENFLSSLLTGPVKKHIKWKC